MRKLIWLGLMLGAVNAAEMPPEEEALPPHQLPTVEEAIPAPVKALGAPVAIEFKGGLELAVSGASEEVQRSVLQGLNHLHGGWEFEASRHFAVAMRADPECLLAHWGMVMATLVPTPETGKARNAAVDRMLELLEQGKGSKLERGYVYGLIKYLEEGPVSAGEAFRKVANEFPNDLQAPMLSALFSRTGYDELGSPTPDQERAEATLLALMKTQPESLLPVNALLVIRAEGANLAPSLELARSLCQRAPDYAPYRHLLGHYEWRCGGHKAASLAFGRATELYDLWLKANRATLADCPEWAKAECYRVVAMASLGDFETAAAAAQGLATTPLPEGRGQSAGVRMMLWETRTLPARLLMARGKPGDAARALAALPNPQSLKPYHAECMAFWWIDALRLVLETQRLAEAGKLDDARQAQEALSFHGTQMARAQQMALEIGERSAWTRAFKALEVLAYETRGKLSLAGPKAMRGAAYNWFRSAADSQRYAVMLYPPVVMSPELVRVGHFQLQDGKPGTALELFNETLEFYPNDISALEGARQTYEVMKQTANAAAVAERIKKLREQ
ncbi:MAG: hypothetical protein K9N23_22250 [Akkermansiaceae bacterium]|nr:hypothetical protein [Akkermansiaceae bacterium]MCF7734421.1 hypothetical protein [Akkermansiaceae bacterium]